MIKEITPEVINTFLEGYDPMKYIIDIECGYMEENVSIIYRDDKGVKRIKKEPFLPFVWAKQNVGKELFGGDRALLIKKMKQYNIWSKGLIVENNGVTTERLQNGYRVMFYAREPMSYNRFMKFFTEGGKPVYGNGKGEIQSNSTREFLAVSPVEQFMMKTGKRMFKGYEDYDDLLRLVFDLETQGLDPLKCSIDQIGIRTNKGFEHVIPIYGTGAERLVNELNAIREALKIIGEIKPDVISGHNSENFDWNFLIVRLEVLHTSMEEESSHYLPKPIYKKKRQSVLKLGGEMEYYHPTVIWGFNVTDSLHAVRRAQAIDSNMKKADLKYVTKYSKLNKPNRVYVPGGDIKNVWADNTNTYAFNNDNGKWFKVTDNTFDKKYSHICGKKQLTDYTEQEIENAKREIIELESKLANGEIVEIPSELKIIAEGNKYEDIYEERLKYTKLEDDSIRDNSTGDIYNEFVTGEYIVKRYLLDDLYETDKVELRYNQSNFLLAKLLPTSFGRVCTMGTAGTWKLLMLAWSFENDIAIPANASTSSFTGGLSRLLSVGYVDRVVKLDYNSLYPSIILTWDISTDEDVSGIMLKLLEYILTERERFKELKSVASKKAKKLKEKLENFEGTEDEKRELRDEIQHYESEAAANDKKQLPFKIFGNSFFGGFGNCQIYNWGDIICAEHTTCNGRQMLRLMIKWFTDKGYKPIVGDSFTGDTPVFIKYDGTGYIDIKPIEEIIDINKIEVDALGREYDTSYKPFKMLCRSGWVKPSYIYRHKTDKPIYKIKERGMEIDVTEDHSLFDVNQNKIKPSDIDENTELEYYNVRPIHGETSYNMGGLDIIKVARLCDKIGRLPMGVLNMSIENTIKFLNIYYKVSNKNEKSKTLRAGLNFLKNKISKLKWGE